MSPPSFLSGIRVSHLPLLSDLLFPSRTYTSQQPSQVRAPGTSALKQVVKGANETRRAQRHVAAFLGTALLPSGPTRCTRLLPRTTGLAGRGRGEQAARSPRSPRRAASSPAQARLGGASARDPAGRRRSAAGRRRGPRFPDSQEPERRLRRGHGVEVPPGTAPGSDAKAALLHPQLLESERGAPATRAQTRVCRGERREAGFAPQLWRLCALARGLPASGLASLQRLARSALSRDGRCCFISLLLLWIYIAHRERHGTQLSPSEGGDGHDSQR
nr:uncharacterized protein LOC127487307 [Oryctolagus cuniculus]